MPTLGTAKERPRCQSTGVGAGGQSAPSLFVGREWARPTLDSRLRGKEADASFGPASLPP
jgi:hypothetical protein